jgi:hypothetical protein
LAEYLAVAVAIGATFALGVDVIESESFFCSAALAVGRMSVVDEFFNSSGYFAHDS